MLICLVFFVQRDHDHAVGPLAVLAFAAVLANQQQVHNVFVLHHAGVGPVPDYILRAQGIIGVFVRFKGLFLLGDCLGGRCTPDAPQHALQSGIANEYQQEECNAKNQQYPPPQRNSRPARGRLCSRCGLFRRFSQGRSRNLRCAFYFAFFFTCNFHLFTVILYFFLKVFYTFPKSVFPNYSASIIFATMAVAVLMYSPMLNFFTTRTS